MSRAVISIIEIYQKAISPDHSFWAKRRFPYGYCRFYPTCSEYAKQSIGQYGMARGILKALWRILRCNPWSAGGFDPVSYHQRTEEPKNA